MKLSLASALVSVIFCFATKAEVPEDAPISSIPAGSKMKLRLEKNLTVLPNTTTTLLTTLEHDGDRDGVGDYRDWCPETPADTKVWAWKDAEAGKTTYNLVGCSGKNEKWIFTTRDYYQTPRGNIITCHVNHESSTESRLIGKNDGFEMVSGEAIESAVAILTIKTPGGNTLEMTCGENHKYLWPQNRIATRPTYDVRNGWQTAIPTIKQMKTIFEVLDMPKAKVIP